MVGNKCTHLFSPNIVGDHIKRCGSINGCTDATHFPSGHPHDGLSLRVGIVMEHKHTVLIEHVGEVLDTHVRLLDDQMELTELSVIEVWVGVVQVVLRVPRVVTQRSEQKFNQQSASDEDQVIEGKWWREGEDI